MEDFYIGQFLTHPEYGPCNVTYVGSEYVGIRVNENEVLVKKAAFLETPAKDEVRIETAGRPVTWPESTFILEDDGAKHYLGSHWEAFFDGIKTILEKLPEMVQKGQLWGDSFDREAPHHLPDGWTRGIAIAWPDRKQGAVAIIGIGVESHSVISLFPFFSQGDRHNLTIRHVNLWKNGLEAQMVAEFGDSIVTFYDVGFTKYRLWYETGRSYDFILGGIAYGAGPAEDMEIEFNGHPDVVAWQRMLAEKSGESIPETSSLRLGGIAAFTSMDGWDADEYSFRGPVKSIRSIEGEILGQQGWILTVTVMRFGDTDADLDILITRRAWQGDAPPSIGRDIEGQLWLQGYLSRPPFS